MRSLSCYECSSTCVCFYADIYQGYFNFVLVISSLLPLYFIACYVCLWILVRALPHLFVFLIDVRCGIWSVSDSKECQWDHSIGAFPLECSTVGRCAPVRTKMTTATTDFPAFLNIMGQQQQQWHSLDLYSSQHAVEHYKYLCSTKRKKNGKRYDWPWCHMSETKGWMWSLGSIQKPGALQQKKTSPTEECSRNFVQFLGALFCWTRSW